MIKLNKLLKISFKMSQNALNTEDFLDLEPGKESGNKQLGKTLKSFKEMAFIVMDDETKAKLKSLGINELPKNVGEKNIDRFIEIIKKQGLWMKNLGITSDYGKYYEIKSSFDNLENYTDELLDLYEKFPARNYDLIYIVLKNIIHLEDKFDIDYQNIFKLIELFYENDTLIGGNSQYINLLFKNLQNQESEDKGIFNQLILVLLKSGSSVNEYCKEFSQRVRFLEKKKSENWDIILKLTSPDKELSTIRPTSDAVKYLIKKYPEQEENIFKGLDKLGNDFSYVLGGSSGFLHYILEKYPEKFVENCENLKKLADFSGHNRRNFYQRCLTNVTQFIVNNPDGWDFLFKVGEIFEKNTIGILDIGKSFIFNLLEYYPDDYEEILMKVREEGEHFHGGNEGYFFTHGLKFLAKFLEGGEEKFFEALSRLKRLNDDELEQNHNTGEIFFEDGLDFATRYLMWFPESWPKIGNKIVKSINKGINKIPERKGSFKQFMYGFKLINSTIFDIDPSILDELLKYYDKIGNRKSDLKIINRLSEYYTLDIVKANSEGIYNHIYFDKCRNVISFILAYLLKHKKSKIIPFIKNLYLVGDLLLDINFPSIFLGGKPLEYLEELELQELFSGESVEQTKIYKNFKKLGGEKLYNLSEIKIWIKSLLVKNGKKFNKTKALPTLIKLQNIFADLILANFDTILKRKIHIKFKTEFKVKEIDDNLINEDFLELYKMYKATRTNKKEAYKLIHNYLEGKVYNGSGDILKKYPYSRKENKEFLVKTLGDKKQVWLSRNEQEFEVENKEQEEENNIQERINHHLKVANEILEDLEIERKFNDPGKLINFFDRKLKREEENIEKSIFSDLKFQIDEIKKLQKSNKSRSISKIKIYHELNPLKKAMMGNWVDGSCLGFYSSVGNYWSAITNALEVNKGVFYIEDETGNIIARVLVCLDDRGALDIHPMYFKGNIKVDLGKYFNKYIKGVSLELGKDHIKSYRLDVELLFCEDWYRGD